MKKKISKSVRVYFGRDITPEYLNEIVNYVYNELYGKKDIHIYDVDCSVESIYYGIQFEGFKFESQY